VEANPESGKRSRTLRRILLGLLLFIALLAIAGTGYEQSRRGSLRAGADLARCTTLVTGECISTATIEDAGWPALAAELKLACCKQGCLCSLSFFCHPGRSEGSAVC
jgi:hypothetical protein